MLIWCGDSWTYGVGLTARKQERFSHLVGQALSIPTVNLAQPGSSIGHLTYKLNQIQRIGIDPTVLFGLTVPSRLCIRQESGKKITVSVNSFDSFGFKPWALDIFNNQHIIDETVLKLSWIAEQCRKRHIKFKFYNILTNRLDFENSKFFQYLDASDWLVDMDWSMYGHLFGINNFNFTKMHILTQTNHGKRVLEKYFLPDHHPNAHGHRELAHTLIEHIKEL